MSIMRQADQYAAFGASDPYRQPREARELPGASEVREFLGGRSVGIGQLNPRHRVAVGTDHMDPDEHAYHTEPGFSAFGPGEGRDWDPNTGYQPSPEDERQMEAIGEDDDSGYNWGPTPGHDPGAEPGPHPDFHGDAPHPFGTPTYSPGGYDPHLGSRLGFNQARRHTADDGQAFNDMLYYPGQRFDEKSELLGNDPDRWPTAGRKTAHGYFPSNRVGIDHKGTIIPGTVTHLDGMKVGVRWDDGQHSSEEPQDIRPL